MLNDVRQQDDYCRDIKVKKKPHAGIISSREQAHESHGEPCSRKAQCTPNADRISGNRSLDSVGSAGSPVFVTKGDGVNHCKAIEICHEEDNKMDDGNWWN